MISYIAQAFRHWHLMTNPRTLAIGLPTVKHAANLENSCLTPEHHAPFANLQPASNRCSSPQLLHVAVS